MATLAGVTGCHQFYCDLGTAYRLTGVPSAAKTFYALGLALAENELQKNSRDSVAKAHLAYLRAHLGQASRAEPELMQARLYASDSVEVAWWDLADFRNDTRFQSFRASRHIQETKKEQ